MAQEIVLFGRNSQFAEPALVKGAVGVLVAPRGRLQLALLVTVAGEQITGYELIADPARLRQLDLSVLSE